VPDDHGTLPVQDHVLWLPVHLPDDCTGASACLAFIEIGSTYRLKEILIGICGRHLLLCVPYVFSSESTRR